MPPSVRKARETDLPRLEALRKEVNYPGSVLYDEEAFYRNPLQQVREYLSRISELPDHRLLVLEGAEGVSGYILFAVDEEHGITHQLQGRLLDFAVFSFDDLSLLIDRAAKIVSAFENEYLVVDLLASDKRQQLWFYRCGFRAELQRSVKRIERGYKGSQSPEYLVRTARTEDLPAILEVHSAYTHCYIPPGRDVDAENIAFRYQLTYLAMDISGSDGSKYLVLEERTSGTLAGYVFLKPGLVINEVSSYYMYDIAVAPAFAGKGLSEYLVGAAETATGEEGGFLYGDGSLSTPVIASWHAQMGAVHDSTLFALDCREA